MYEMDDKKLGTDIKKALDEFEQTQRAWDGLNPAIPAPGGPSAGAYSVDDREAHDRFRAKPRTSPE